MPGHTYLAQFYYVAAGTATSAPAFGPTSDPTVDPTSGPSNSPQPITGTVQVNQLHRDSQEIGKATILWMNARSNY